MSNILDRSNTYLSIFTNEIKIDKNLPKWKLIEKETGKKSDFYDAAIQITNTNTFLNVRNDADGITFHESVIDQPISLEEITSLSAADFNIYLGKRIANDIRHNSFISFDSGSTTPTKTNEQTGFIKTVKHWYKRFIGDTTGESEEKYEMNIFDFFANVKLTAKENESQYAMRIEPYMIAMKQAQEMGQQALVDKLAAELFNNKYESILFAEGLHYKITERQVVDFVKRTEKGVRLDYISNFIRPIPTEVIEAKKKADKLLVFDNYCILYYDPEAKSFSQTEEEKERERQKKADPILFGMISGSRNLYYITDWIDEYCDLTLDEFIKVSGLNKKHLKIGEKIKIG